MAAGLLALPSVALGTVDGGKSAALVAVGGTGHRYAIVLEADVQEECGGRGCRVYHVDVTAPQFKRLAPRRLRLESMPPEAALVKQYLDLLPEVVRVQLSEELAFSSELRRVPIEAGRGRISTWVDGRRVQGRLERLWTVASMNAYDRYKDHTQPCAYVHENRALCSACHKTVRWLDGERIDTWECEERGTRLDGSVDEATTAADERGAADARPCACAARAHMYALVLDDGAQTVRGSKVLVEPFRTWQDIVGRPGEWLDDTGLRYGLGQASVTLFVTKHGHLLVVGSAVHLPEGNGTYFPVFAAMKL